MSRRFKAAPRALMAALVGAALLLTTGAWALLSKSTTTPVPNTRSTGSSRGQQYSTRTTGPSSSTCLHGWCCWSSRSSTSSHRMGTITRSSAPSRRAFSTLALLLSASNNNYYNNDDEGGGGMLRRNEARCNIQNFLTQRAIQSFLFMCETVRDPHSVKYLEDFLGATNLLNYHGCGVAYRLDDERFGGSSTGADCGADWTAPLVALTQQPPEVMIVSAKRRGRGHGGWSKNNPHLEERWVDFEIDIDPVGLAARILQVREQIAREWVGDLAVLRTANEQILESYFARARRARDAGEGAAPAAAAAAFERTAVPLLNNHTNFAASPPSSSPFRRGSFDLLSNLCTQAAVHQLLQQLGENRRAHDVSYAWLRDFYAERAAEYFDGDVPYGRADDFIEQLLLAPPALVPQSQQQQQSGQQLAQLADPFGIAEQIILLRSDIAAEWRENMLDVPAAHSGIRKVLLEKQMEAWGSSTPLGGGGSGDSGGSGGSFE